MRRDALVDAAHGWSASAAVPAPGPAARRRSGRARCGGSTTLSDRPAAPRAAFPARLLGGRKTASMDGFELTLAGVLVSVVVLNVLASRIGIPYPIVLVLGGLALGLLPGMPRVELEPDIVLLVFLPPLLYSAAFFAEPRTLRGYARAL